MVRDKRFTEVARSRSPSPLDMIRSRDFGSSRNRNYSPDSRRGEVEYSPAGGKSCRVKRTDRHCRDFDARGCREYGDRDRDIGGGRDRDRYMVGGGRSRSPRTYQYHGDRDPQSPLVTKQRDDFDRDVCLRSIRLLGSDECGKNRDAVGFDSGVLRRSYDEPHRRDGLGDHFGRYKSYDRVSVWDYDCTGKYCGFGETNLTREEDYLKNSRHLDSSHGGPLSGLQYYGSTKPSSLECEMGGSIHSALNSGPADDIPMSKQSSARGGIHMSSVTSPHLSSFTGDRGHFHLQDDSHQEKRDATCHVRDHYFEKKYAEFYHQDELLGIEKRMGKGIDNDGKEQNVQSSRDYFYDYNNYTRSSGNIHMTSHSIKTGMRLSSGPVDYAGEKERMISPKGFGVQMNDTKSQSRLYVGLPEEKHEDLLSPEYGRSKIHLMTLRPVEEDYGHHYSPKTNGSDLLFDESSHKRNTREGSRKMFPHPEARLTPEKVGAYGSVHERRDLEISHDGNSYLNYDSEMKRYSGYGSGEIVEHYNRGDGERYDVLQSREYTPSASRFCDSPRKKFGLADLNLAEQSERWLRYKHDKDELPYEYDLGYQISTDENGIRKIWRASTDMVNYQPSSSQFLPRHSTSTRKYNDRDIKKRLRPVSRKLHVSQRLKKYKPSAKKRSSAPAPSRKRTSLPWLKNMTSNRKSVVGDYLDSSDHNHDGDQSEVRATFTNPEPPEGSEDFKQLVQSSFFKFLKHFNETPMKRKYTYSGKAGSLKCSVCGSNSEEFADTNGLVKHAFTSEKAGVRSQHLGLHKALCALMGWKIVDQRCGEWHCEAMSDADILTMREDIIIWPPVVIVHNNNIADKNIADEQQAMKSTENMDMNLRGMGFVSIVKVGNGKPANQSVMVVMFSGTLSGLQEATRLHKMYVESKRGRAEFEQCCNAKKGSNIGEYGYLGIVEDLDKVDLDTRKRCVLKSKKEIFRIWDGHWDVRQ